MSQKLSKAARKELEQLLADWDLSGKPKTSAYYRLQERLYPDAAEPRFADHVTGGDEEGRP
jgi:hypothetical protein